MFGESPRREELERLFAEVDGLDRPLADKLLIYATEARAIAPDLLAAEDGMIDRLAAADTTATVPKYGARFPVFTLPDCRGTLVYLPTLLADGPLIVTVNRGHWCPYDRLQLRELARSLPLLGIGPVQIVAVLPETMEFTVRLAHESHLPFRVLSDRHLGYALTLGLPVWSGDEVIRAFHRYGIDLPRFQGDSGWMQPIAATFVLDQGGYVRASFSGPDIRRRMPLEEIEVALRQTSIQQQARALSLTHH